MILIREFEFDAAHYLPDYHGKCEAMHGHTYKLVVKIAGDPMPNGMLMDFADVKAIVENNALKFLDHTCLNEVLKQPSAENIVVWVWQALEKPLRRDNCALYELELWETRTCGVSYRGEAAL
jgi:6-pyruvoyltetrahydropterin/6-carboxytetrahydropterin synthase